MVFLRGQAGTYYEVDGTDPSGSGGVRHYSTKHPVIREITRNLRTSHRALRSVIRAEPAPENSEAEALLAKIVAKYRHTSLAEKLTKDPLVCGPHGMADIQLVLGAFPRIQRPYHLVGEREAALHEHRGRVYRSRVARALDGQLVVTRLRRF